MKFIHFIFSFYLLVLSAIPCCAFDDCSSDKSEEPAGIERSKNHKEENKGCSNCSPFFNCEGCVAATTIFEPVEFTLSFFQPLPDYTGYIQMSLPRIDYDFWQPPKLG
jgi:hypothetical protein